jgi:hypothetical protein
LAEGFGQDPEREARRIDLVSSSGYQLTQVLYPCLSCDAIQIPTQWHDVTLLGEPYFTR